LTLFIALILIFIYLSLTLFITLSYPCPLLFITLTLPLTLTVGEVLINWQRLIYTFEKHASRSLIRNTASSSLTRISNFFTLPGLPGNFGPFRPHRASGGEQAEVKGSTDYSIEKAREKAIDEEKKEKKKIAMLLGGEI
jgi:hypothetical protein